MISMIHYRRSGLAFAMEFTASALLDEVDTLADYNCQLSYRCQLEKAQSILSVIS